MIKTKNIVRTLGLVLISNISYLSSTFAQDIHFSQTTMIPLALNPALTGGEGDQRAFLNYKNQWKGLSANGSAFNTAFFSVDGSFFKKRWDKGFLGAGITGFKDVAGDLKMGTTQINLSFAGIVKIGVTQTLSGGLQAGFVQKSVSTANMQWESQYDASIGGYNSSIISNDLATLPPSRYADISFGLAWGFISEPSSLGSNDQIKTTLGFAVQNVNTPKQEFSNFGNDQLYRKYVFHGTAQIGIPQTDVAIVPNAAYYMQGPSSQLNIGTLVRWTIKEKSRYTGVYKGTALSLGAHYRLQDAIVPMLLLEYSNYSFGVSYDVNVSGLTTATRGRGGIEISLKYVNPNPFRSAPRLRDND